MDFTDELSCYSARSWIWPIGDTGRKSGGRKRGSQDTNFPGSLLACLLGLAAYFY